MANLVNSHVLGIHLLGQYFRPKKTQTQKNKEFLKVLGSLVPSVWADREIVNIDFLSLLFSWLFHVYIDSKNNFGQNVNV